MKYLRILCCLLCASGQAYAADVDMQSLMQLFVMNKNIKTEFVERKYVRILDEPVESKGDLIFIAPMHLEKNTKLPRAESMTVDGNKVSIERGTFKRSMSLDDFADMSSLVHSLTATLRGDQLGIEKFFAWTLTGPIQKWQLVLRPKNSFTFAQIREIRFAGENGYIYSIETTLSDGDWSLMMLKRPVKLAIP